MLVIDPSIVKCGVAIFDSSSPIHATCLNFSKYSKEPELDRMARVINGIEEWHMAMGIYLEHNSKMISTVAIETPPYQYVDTNKKSIMLLHKLIGWLACYYRMNNKKVIEVPVTSWKGHIGKNQTESEINLLYPIVSRQIEKIAKTSRNNAYDAVGIGHYVISRKGML